MRPKRYTQEMIKFIEHNLKLGECICGRKELSINSGLSEQQIRTSLKKLKNTKNVTIKTTNKYTIISVVNWNLYQDINQQDNQQITNNQPTTNQQLTTLIDNKNKEDNNSLCDIRARLENETINNSAWLDQTMMALRTTEVLQLAMDVMQEWELTAVPAEQWTPGHLFNHIRKKLDIRKRQARPTKQEEKAEWRAKMLQSIQNDLMYGSNPKQ